MSTEIRLPSLNLINSEITKFQQKKLLKILTKISEDYKLDVEELKSKYLDLDSDNQCSATNSSGKPCGRKAKKGTKLCPSHSDI